MDDNTRRGGMHDNEASRMTPAMLPKEAVCAPANEFDTLKVITYCIAGRIGCKIFCKKEGSKDACPYSAKCRGRGLRWFH
jgi:hypothetical protein